MRAKATYAITAAALLCYLVLAGGRGVLLLRHGTALTVAFGAAALVLPLLGLWFLWQNTRFVRRANRLAAELSAEKNATAAAWGGPVADQPDQPGQRVRAPRGRLDREAADAAFRQRKAETERTPDDWRCWFHLAVAYRDARDTPRARRAIQRAIALREGRIPVREGRIR